MLAPQKPLNFEKLPFYSQDKVEFENLRISDVSFPSLPIIHASWEKKKILWYIMKIVETGKSLSFTRVYSGAT